MKCSSCGSERIMSVNGHCQDRCVCNVNGKEHGPHYVPRDMGIGGGDYIEFQVCLQCGQLQDWEPVEELPESFK